MRTPIEFGAATEMPGEVAAIQAVCAFGEQYGYGNLIHRLLAEWSARMEQNYGLPPGSQMTWGSDEIAERAARQDKVIASLQEKAAKWDELEADIEAANLPDSNEMVQRVMAMEAADKKKWTDLEAKLAAVQAPVNPLLAENTRLQELCDAREQLCIAYRTGNHITATKALDRINAAEAAKAERKGET